MGIVDPNCSTTALPPFQNLELGHDSIARFSSMATIYTCNGADTFDSLGIGLH